MYKRKQYSGTGLSVDVIVIIAFAGIAGLAAVLAGGDWGVGNHAVSQLLSFLGGIL